MSETGLSTFKPEELFDSGPGFSQRQAAHDLNNQLAIIQGQAEMLLADEQLTAQGNDCVAQILRAAERAGRLSRQLASGVGSTPEALVPNPPALEELPVPDGKPDGGSERILLAVTDRGVRRFAGLLLQDLGYSVTEVASPPAAKAAWDQEQGRFDLILADVGPAEMDGLVLVEQFRHSAPRLKAVLLSAGPFPARPGPGASGAGVRWLARPFQPEELAKTVRDCLDLAA